MTELCDGTLMGVADEKTFKRWSHTGEILNVFEGHTFYLSGAIEMEDDTIVSSAWSRISPIKMWSLATSRCLYTMESSEFSPSSLLKLRAQHMFACGFFNGAIHIQRATQSKGFELLKVLRDESIFGSVMSLAELSDGTIVSGLENFTLQRWDISKSQCVGTFRGHRDIVRKVLELRDKTIASCSNDTTIRIWDVDSGECLKIIEGHALYVSSIVELADGTIASTSGDNTVRVWKKNGTCLSVFSTGDTVSSLLQLKDRSIAFGYSNGRMEIHETWNQ